MSFIIFWNSNGAFFLIQTTSNSIHNVQETLWILFYFYPLLHPGFASTTYTPCQILRRLWHNEVYLISLSCLGLNTWSILNSYLEAYGLSPALEHLSPILQPTLHRKLDNSRENNYLWWGFLGLLDDLLDSLFESEKWEDKNKKKGRMKRSVPASGLFIIYIW